jgi:hypothetical protein
MRMVRVNEEAERLDFADRAAKCFEERPEVRTYTDSGKVEQGELFAVRWGMDADCVVVLKVDEYFEPANYQNIVDNMKAKEHTRLIAASTDLLEACKALLSSEMCERELPPALLPEAERVVHMARQAIAKAEGR